MKNSRKNNLVSSPPGKSSFLQRTETRFLPIWLPSHMPPRLAEAGNGLIPRLKGAVLSRGSDYMSGFRTAVPTLNDLLPQKIIWADRVQSPERGPSNSSVEFSYSRIFDGSIIKGEIPLIGNRSLSVFGKRRPPS